MSRKLRHWDLDDFSDFDDDGMFADDLDIDEFLGEHERPFAVRKRQRDEWKKHDYGWSDDDDSDY